MISHWGIVCFGLVALVARAELSANQPRQWTFGPIIWWINGRRMTACLRTQPLRLPKRLTDTFGSARLTDWFGLMA